jgi:formate dehydrogenase maturation protein FdhE
VAAIRAAMQLFVEDDLARGVRRTDRLYCDACQRPRPAAGGIRYGRYALCNGCATEYEVARAHGGLATPGQFVRDKHFGEDERYLLSD